MKASRQEQCLTIKLNQKMKKNIFISAALACVAFSSCQQENLGGNGAELDGFRVHTEDMTKAVLDGVKVVFEDADAIDIYADAAETPAVYSYNKANDLFVATGTEAEGEEYTAIFPSTATNPSRSTIYISNRQVATVNSFPKNSMYMAGVSNSKEMTLKHLTGLWEIDLLPQYDGQKLVRASLTMNGGQKINGNFEVDFTDNSLTYIDGGNSSILLAEIAYVMTAGVPVKLYFALPEGKYEGGFTFTATMTDGTTMDVTSLSTINIARGQITKVKNDVAYRLFASGTGTEADPYVIKGANHWNNMVRKVNTDATNYANAYYKLGADIDFKNEKVDSIHVFKGVLDGGNYTLKNAKIGDGTASHQAFFYLLNGTVKNLKFDNITVTGGNATGAASSAAVIAAGNSKLAFTVENCHVSNSTVISGPHEGDKGGSYAAGLVGRCSNENAIIKNCSVTNSIITSEVENTGGAIGLANICILENIVSSGNTITSKSHYYAGGIAGNIGTANVSGVTTSNNVVNATRYVGGLSGAMTSGEACNIVSSGNQITSGSSYTGGVVGNMKGGTIDTVLSFGNTVESGTSYTGGIVGVMEAATLINASSKNNVCIINNASCGGVVGICTSVDGKIINIFSDGNTVKCLKHSYAPYLGLIIGGHKDYRLGYLLANTLVLTGTTTYVFESTDASKTFAGAVGIVMGDGVNTIVNSGYYFQNYRSRFDVPFYEARGTTASTTNGYRFAVGVLQSTGTSDSKAGDDEDFTVSKEAALTDGTVLNALNAWVEANKATYPTLKSWAARTTGKAFPEIVLEESAASGVNSLNIIESNY